MSSDLVRTSHRFLHLLILFDLFCIHPSLIASDIKIFFTRDVLLLINEALSGVEISLRFLDGVDNSVSVSEGFQDFCKKDSLCSMNF